MMPGAQLKRAERAIAAMRTAEALDEIVAAIRTVEGRLAKLEGKGKAHPAASMDLPNRG
jgi:hypothetical protein